MTWFYVFTVLSLKVDIMQRMEFTEYNVQFVLSFVYTFPAEVVHNICSSGRNEILNHNLLLKFLLIFIWNV
jgi:hypothetical protein